MNNGKQTVGLEESGKRAKLPKDTAALRVKKWFASNGSLITILVVVISPLFLLLQCHVENVREDIRDVRNEIQSVREDVKELHGDLNFVKRTIGRVNFRG